MPESVTNKEIMDKLHELEQQVKKLALSLVEVRDVSSKSQEKIKIVEQRVGISGQKPKNLQVRPPNTISSNRRIAR